MPLSVKSIIRSCPVFSRKNNVLMNAAPDTDSQDDGRNELMRSMSESVEVRQAMVALLVKYAAATKSPPEMPPNVRRYTSRRRLDSIGMVGEWLESYLAFTGDPRHVTPVNTGMDALAAACGGWVSDGRNTEPQPPHAAARASIPVFTGVTCLGSPVNAK